jgi:hypothetical protein
MLPRNQRQEALSRAYVSAVAARAGVVASKPDPDLGIDLSLRSVRQVGNLFQDAGVLLDLQLRSTTRAAEGPAQVAYDIDVRTYDFLRTAPPMCPRLLVVLVLPDDEAEWLSQSVDELILRRCAYWYSLRGAAATTATSSVRLFIPREQVFSAEALQGFLRRLTEGGEL